MRWTAVRVCFPLCDMGCVMSRVTVYSLDKTASARQVRIKSEHRTEALDEGIDDVIVSGEAALADRTLATADSRRINIKAKLNLSPSACWRGDRYEGIADTFVQLFRLYPPGLMATVYRIRSNRARAAQFNRRTDHDPLKSVVPRPSPCPG